ncbi:hypothetical protein HAX54_017985, partial [Datura stramonium]|nr:hypothetical protein [Datura stramonium]
ATALTLRSIDTSQIAIGDSLISRRWKVQGSWVLPSASYSPAVYGSLPAARRSSIGAASFFMMIPHL